MALDSQIAKLIGEQAVGDIAQRVAVRGLKLKNFAGTEDPATPGYSTVDVSGALPHGGEGFGARLVANRNFAATPELFWGPFMQLGTHLGLGPTWLQIAIDIVTDVPGNLLALGTGGLVGGAAKARSLAKMTTALGSSLTKRKGGVALGKISGEAIVDEAMKALDVAGKLVGRKDEFMAAAKSGSKSLISFVDEAVATGKVADDMLPVLEAMKKNRKGLSTIIDNADKMREIKQLPGSAFLQPTQRARVAAGQSTDLLRVPLPVKDGKPSLTTFMRQMVGFAYRDDVYWVPASRTVSKGLDRVAKRSLIVDDALPLADELNIEQGLQAADELRAAVGSKINNFLSGKHTSGDGGMDHVYQSGAHWKVMLGTPTDRKYVEYGATYTDDQMRRNYAGFAGLDPDDVDPTDAGFLKFKEFEERRLAQGQAAADKATMAQSDAMIAQAAKSLDGSDIGQAESAMGIDRAISGGSQARLRSLLDTFSLDSMRYDMVSPGHAFRARASFGTLLAHTMSKSSDDVMRKAYTDGRTRKFMSQLIPDMIDQPDAFVMRNGRLVVDKDKAGGFLNMRLKEAARDNPKLFEHLTVTGIDEQVGQLAEAYRDILSVLGETLYDEGVIRGFYSEYFPRVFTPNKKFFERIKKARRGDALVSKRPQIADALLDEGDNPLLKEMLENAELAPQVKKMRAGKMSLQEHRKFSDDMAVWLQEKGYGKYDRDGVSMMSRYLDAANKAHLMTRLVRDAPAMSPSLTRAVLDEDSPEIGRVVSDDKLRNVKRVMLLSDSEYKEMGNLGDAFEIVNVRARPLDEPMRLADERIRKNAYRQEAKRRVADRLVGKTEIGDIKVVGKDGNPVKIEAEWLGTEIAGQMRVGGVRVPKSVRNAGQVRKELNKAITKQSKEGVVRRLVDERMGKPAHIQHNGKKLYVYKKDRNQLVEPFRLYRESGVDPNSTWAKVVRAYDNVAFSMKSAVLLGDIFHYNVLATSQFLTNPRSILPRLTDESGRLLPGVRSGAFLRSVNAGSGAIAGGTAGAAAGASLDADTEGMAGFSLAGALYGAMIGAATRNAKAATRLALNPDNLDTLRMMGLGGWTGRPDDRAIGAMQRWLGAARDAASRSPAGKAFVHPLDMTVGALDAWDHQLWGLMHNGSKHFYFDQMWRKELPKLEESGRYAQKALKETYETLLKEGPEGAAAAKVFKNTGEQIPVSEFIKAERHRMQVSLAREINQAANDVFGGQNFAAMLENPEITRTLRRFLLSPDWTTSRLRLASSMLMNMSDPQRAAVGASLGAGMELVDAGFDIEEVGIPSVGITAGALMGVVGGRWAQRSLKRMATPGDYQAREARRLMTAALAGGYVFSELLNKALTGHWMHENEEGKKLSIQLPGKQANGRANYMRLGKPWLEAFEFAGVVEREKFPIPGVSRISTKLNVPIQGVLRLVNNRNIFGPIMMGDEEANEMGLKLIDVAVDTVTPIIAQGPIRLGAAAVRGDLDARTAALAGLRFAGQPISTGRNTAVDFSPFLRQFSPQAFINQAPASPVPRFGGALR